MRNKIKKEIENIYSILQKYQDVPGKPAGIVDEDNVNYINGVKIKKLSLNGFYIDRNKIRNIINCNWKQQFGIGRWNNKIVTENSYSMSDTRYYCLDFQSLKKLTSYVDTLMRDLLIVQYEKAVFDCDDFMRLFVSLCSVVAYHNNVRGGGIGVGSIKVDWFESTRLLGHALNFAIIKDLYNTELKIVEPQNTKIYNLPDKYEIHYLEI